MSELMSLEAAAEVLRAAMRETVRRHRIWYLVQAGLMSAAGVLALLYPLLSSTAAVQLLGWLLVLTGAAQGIGLIGSSKVPHFWLQLISVALSIVIGFMFVRAPESGMPSLTLLLVVFFLVEGISKIVFALTVRPLESWAWVLGAGIVAIVLAALLIAYPSSSIWFLGMLIGVQLISTGVALGYLAWHARETRAVVIVEPQA